MPQGDMRTEVNNLKDEVIELRGIIAELKKEIKKIKEQPTQVNHYHYHPHPTVQPWLDGPYRITFRDKAPSGGGVIVADAEAGRIWG